MKPIVVFDSNGTQTQSKVKNVDNSGVSGAVTIGALSLENYRAMQSGATASAAEMIDGSEKSMSAGASCKLGKYINTFGIETKIQIKLEGHFNFSFKNSK